MLKPFKKLKGGLAQLIVTVFILIVSVLVFYSAIHPAAGSIRDQGDYGRTKILTEKADMETDFVPIP